MVYINGLFLRVKYIFCPLTFSEFWN